MASRIECDNCGEISSLGEGISVDVRDRINRSPWGMPNTKNFDYCSNKCMNEHLGQYLEERRKIQWQN